MKWVLGCCAGILVLILSAAYKPARQTISQGHWEFSGRSNGELPDGDNGFFIGSGKCAGCHGLDLSSVPIANLTSEGVHVSPTEDWRATMMANSARDPFWRAKVAHEISVNPALAQDLQNKCTSCHAPVGRYSALHFGEPNYTMDELDGDPLALDGISCAACHQQRMDNIGKHFSGELFYHSDTIWGPYIGSQLDPPLFDFIMTNFVGITPAGHEKFERSETCAGCHTLATHSVDLSGNYTGSDFIEQATYHEWLNSVYNSEGPQRRECQGCHMPRLDEPIIIASGYSWMPPREPFGQHWLVGGNTYMLQLMKNRIDELGITATTQHFNTVIDRTLNLLQQETAQLELSTGEVDGDTARFIVKITNLAGHKFPSGYPARRAFLEVKMSDQWGNVLFHSGRTNSQQFIVGEDNTFEPHFDVIRADDQIQIYEMVMGDVNGNPTTVLARAHTMLKDNRLVPAGFSTVHAAYDTTAIVGAAFTDPNFNYINGIEGSGTDEVRYHIPVSGINGHVTVTARLLYQSVPPKWNEEMFSVSHPVIDAFRQMYMAEDPMPVAVASATTETLLTGIRELKGGIRIGPNPSSDGQVWISNATELIKSVTIFDVNGKRIEQQIVQSHDARITLPSSAGTYLLEVTNAGGRRSVHKVMRR